MSSKRSRVEQCCWLKGTAGCCRKKKRDDLPERARFLLDLNWVNDDAMLKTLHLCRTMSESQLEVVKRARSPHCGVGRITNVMAAAAAGKTTTMLALDTTHRGLGHSGIMYCLYNTEAANDVKRKLGEIGIASTEDVRTLDGWVQTTLYRSFGGFAVRCPVRNPECRFWMPGEKNGSLWTDNKVCDRVLSRFKAEIDSFLQEANCLSERNCRLCAFWVYKTYLGWVQSDKLIESLDAANKDKDGTHSVTYYPCKLDYYQRNDTDGNQKLPGTVPGSFYADRAREWWEDCVREGTFYSYACATKYLQLCKHVFTPRVIIVDESQDLTPCQVELFISSQEHADVFVVGDSVQCLYAWRGAVPSKITFLSQNAPSGRDVKDDITLCESYRFGGGIADIANHILYIKGHSRQASEWCRPYWVTGCGPPTELVCTHGSLPFPYTVIGRTNAGLCIEAIETLLRNSSTKIRLIGDGHKDVKDFKRRLRQTLELSPFYGKEVPFVYRGFSCAGWNDFLSVVESFELDYSFELKLLSKYGSDQAMLHRIVDLVKVHVLDTAVKETNYDVLLTTVCKAKGLQWFSVKVLDDLQELVRFESIPSEPDETLASVPMQFKSTQKGDNLNSWYVAITRAQTKLLLPAKFKQLISILSSMEVPKAEFSDQEVAGIKDLLKDMKDTLQSLAKHR